MKSEKLEVKPMQNVEPDPYWEDKSEMTLSI
jgi:hypothetical protein